MASFKQDSTVKQLDSHTYSVNFVPRWCIGNVPNGGFVTGCVLSAVRTHFETTLKRQKQPHPLALHLSFVRRTTIGQATIHVQEAKLGRQTSTVRVSLSQPEAGSETPRECIIGTVTQADVASLTGPEFSTQWSLVPPPIPVDHDALQKGTDKHWFHMDTIPFQDFRKAVQQFKFHLPKAGSVQPNIVDEWICFRSGEPFTMDSLGLVADTFPQLIEQYERPTTYDSYTYEPPDVQGLKFAKYWFPTLVLNLEVKKALPPGGVKWLFVRTEAKQIRNGRYDLELVILDAGRELVALSHHVCMAVPAARNLAKIGSAGTKL